MTVKIYHNPRCSKSRQTLELIKNSGIEPQIIEYLKNPLIKNEIKDIANNLSLSNPVEMMRTKEAVFKENNLKKADTEALFEAIEEHPILLERPIVITEKGTRICRPPELVKEIL
jgi:arsenate reductase